MCIYIKNFNTINDKKEEDGYHTGVSVLINKPKRLHDDHNMVN